MDATEWGFGDAEEQRGTMPRAGVANFSVAVLRRAMSELDMLPDELAEEVGVSRQAVSAWLTGQSTPSPQSLLRIAEAVNLTPEVLTPRTTGREKLTDLRAHAGMTQSSAARALEISATTLSGIERGRRARAGEIVESMAALYGATASDVEAAWDRTVADRERWLEIRRAARRTEK